MHGKRGSSRCLSKPQSGHRERGFSKYAYMRASHAWFYINVNIGASDEYVIHAAQNQHLQNSKVVLLGLGNVTYWLHCQNTNVAKRLDFYLNKHNLHG